MRILAGGALATTIAAAGVAVAACSSFGADASAPDGPNADAAPGPIADAAPDAAPDGEAPDAAFEASSPGARFCDQPGQTNLTFCADFDEDPFDVGWAGRSTYGSGITLGVVPVSATNRALRVQLAGAASNSGDALYYDLSQRSSVDVTLAFKLALLSVDSANGGQYLELATLACIKGGAHTSSDLSLGVAYSNGSLQLYSGPDSIATLPAEIGASARYVIHVAIPAPPFPATWVEVAVDGVGQDVSLSQPAPPTLNTNIRFSVGVTFDAQDKSGEALIDDATLFLKP